MLAHSESKAVFVEDAEQLAKVRAVEGNLPHLEHIVIFDPSGDLGDAIPLSDLRERGAARDVADLGRAATRSAATTSRSPSTPPARPARPRAACSATRTTGTMTTITEERRMMGEPDEVVYLFLPLAHAFAKLVQFVTIDSGGAIAYWEKEPTKIIPNLAEVKPTYFPSVPRMFEKIYTLATNAATDKEKLAQAVRSASRSASCSSAARTCRRSSRPGSTPPRRRSTRTSARSSGGASASASPAPRRSRRRSSSSSTPVASR